MKRGYTIALTLAGIGAAATAESYLAATRDRLNSATYAVPHKYEFSRNFSLPCDGRTFSFYIRQENLGIANRVPDFVASRLNEWRT